MATFAELIAAIQGAASTVVEAGQSTQSGGGRISGAMHLLGRVGVGSGDDRMLQAAAGYQAALDAAVRAATLLQQAQDDIAAYVEGIGGSALAARPAQAAERQEWLDAGLSPEEVERALESLPPKSSAGDGVPTMGWLYAGKTRKPVQSGRGPRVAGVYTDLEYQASVAVWQQICERVVGKYRDSMWDLDTAGHAELKAVVAQHASKVKHTALTINHPDGPCNGHPTRCRELLQEYLPKGHTMTIYWRNGAGAIEELLVRGRG